MSTLQANASSASKPFTLQLTAHHENELRPATNLGTNLATNPGTRSAASSANRSVRESFKLSCAVPGAPAPQPTRAIRIGSVPGRVNLQARRVTPALAAKHSQLVRGYLAEPVGDFDRCLSIALDRMIDAIEAGADANARR